jgi:hypothetical protein
LLTIEIIVEAATTLTYACSGSTASTIHAILDLKIKGVANIVERVRKFSNLRY